MLQVHIRQYLPGKPNIVIRNMPAAGGTVGANYAYGAKPDGRTVLISSSKTVMQNILRPKGVDFYLEKMHPVYSAPIGSVYYVAPGVVKEPKDVVNAKGLIFGHEAATNGTTGNFLWPKELLGIKVEKLVLGYDSSGDARLAFLSGEVTCSGGSTIDYNASMKPYVEKGDALPIYQSGMLDENGEVVKEPAAPADIPTVRELYIQIYGKEPSGMKFEACKLVIGTRTFGKALLLPEKTPADIVRAYREAAIKMTKNAKFLEEAARLIPGAPHFVGEKFAKVYPKGVAGSPDVIEFMKNYYTKEFDIVFD
jgi:tripartite-type tricarboxylate transporter receptor subunit TctC